MMLEEMQSIFTDYFSELIRWINSQPGYRCTIGEVERTQITQDFYFKTGKTKVKLSEHQFNLAGDLRIFKLVDGKWTLLTKTEDYKFAGLYWESMERGKTIWGGRFGDNPNTEEVEGWDGNHFQYSNHKEAKA